MHVTVFAPVEILRPINDQTNNFNFLSQTKDIHHQPAFALSLSLTAKDTPAKSQALDLHTVVTD